MVKVCGLTRSQDVQDCVRAGVDLVGFVLAASPRRVSCQAMSQLIGGLSPDGSTRPVAVLVDPLPDEVQQAFEAGAAYVQLHGQESPEFCQRWASRVIKALRVRTPEDLSQARRYQSCAGLLLDSPRPGGGEPWDWSWLHGFELPYILAGGLSPENLPEVLRTLRPQGVDASSALEVLPGCKDPRRILEFVKAARSA